MPAKPHKVVHLPKKNRGGLTADTIYGKMKYTVQEVAMAIRVNKGFLTHAAKSLGTSFNTVKQYIELYPELKDVISATKERSMDDAEYCLFDQMEQGNFKAVQFYLASQARSRGYGKEADKKVEHNYTLTLPKGFGIPTLEDMTSNEAAIDVTATEVSD